MSKKKFYAYYLLNESEKGIVENWSECQKIVKGKSSRYKSFSSLYEAKEWLENGAEYEKNKSSKKNKKKSKDEFLELIMKLDKEAIYFDAGTGRGQGVEVRITDYDGSSLLNKIINESKINEFGNYFLSKDRTNNFGELVGMYAALQYAQKYSVKKICGDSKLVIDYWSNGYYNEKNLDKDTIELINKVKKLREEYEKDGGVIELVSGDFNPADLGFHK